MTYQKIQERKAKKVAINNCRIRATKKEAECGKPTREEIRKAIKQLKIQRCLLSCLLFAKIWEEEQIPSEWKEGLLIKIPKKGTLAYVQMIEESHSCLCQGKY